MKVSEKNKILFAGLNTVDIQYLLNQFPEENAKTRALQNEIRAGGPATNAAIACAYLGSDTDLFTPIGEHTLSEFLRNELKNYGVQVLDPISGLPGKPVFSSIITSKENASRTVYYYNPEISVSLKENEYPDLILYKLAMFDGFYSGIALPLAKKCQKAGITTILDGGSWKNNTEALLASVDIAICSNDFTVPGGETPEDIFIYLHAKGVTHIAITRGADSILYSEPGSTGEIQVNSVNVTDTLGAGDIFHGAFCHYFAMGNTFTESLYLASVIAGESCKTFGTRQWMTKDK